MSSITRASGVLLAVALAVAVPAMLVASGISGCATQQHEARLAGFEPPSSGEGVQVVLAWAAPVDLDLYVTDPTLETVYFGNTPSGTDGRLETDVRCDGLAPSETVHVERIAWKSPPSGRYRLGVDYARHCGTELDAVRFRVIALADGERWTGEEKVRFHEFTPAVLEFEVGRRRNP